jgi:hypothetical protein
MRKAFLIILFLLVTGYWILVTGSYAAPCYGTKMPKEKQIFIGVQTHSIFKRYLEGENGKLKTLQNFILLSYGVFDWLSLDLKAGAGYVKQHPSNYTEIDYSTGFAGGYGFRLKLFDFKKINTVFGFQHISVHPKSKYIEDLKHRAILDDWQVSLLAARDFGKVTPYIGTRWSRVDYIHRVEESRKRVMSDRTKNIGLILGCDISLNEKIWLNLEGNLFDSEAASLSINYKF